MVIGGIGVVFNNFYCISIVGLFDIITVVSFSLSRTRDLALKKRLLTNKIPL
jgi:hypothetical protein